MTQFTSQRTWYQETTPDSPGMYLVQIHQLEECIPPAGPEDMYIIDLGGEFISLAHWDGTRWDNIIIDDFISTDDSDPIFLIDAWASRGVSSF